MTDFQILREKKIAYVVYQIVDFPDTIDKYSNVSNKISIEWSDNIFLMSQKEKMIIANKYEIPDSCPYDCKYKGDYLKYGQDSMCIRCPVFNFTFNDADSNIAEAKNFNCHWAEEWSKFFKGEIEKPSLGFLKKEYEKLHFEENE
ncbi:MAG: hypothetical protein ACTSYH_03640 [Candidatus Heimdallarchaeaceae archaeon]